MAEGDMIFNIGGNVYDLSDYSPTVTWKLRKTIEYFKFPGSPEKIMLDLLENEEHFSVDCRIVASSISDITDMMIDVRENGTDPQTNLTTVAWSTVGTLTISINDMALTQKAGEGTFYNLSIKAMMTEGPV